MILIAPSAADDCIDWHLGRHREAEITCDVRHGDGHKTADDIAAANLPTLDTCNECHTDQVEQFSRGKHALAWVAMEAMPTTHALPLALTQGTKGCGGCHKLGIKSAAALP